jgi:hypothetical protein
VRILTLGEFTKDEVKSYLTFVNPKLAERQLDEATLNRVYEVGCAGASPSSSHASTPMQLVEMSGASVCVVLNDLGGRVHSLELSSSCMLT